MGVCTLYLFSGPKPSFVEELARRGGKSSRIARCSSKPESETENRKTRTRIVKEKSVSVILLAGGKGKRMGVSLFLFQFTYFISLHLSLFNSFYLAIPSSSFCWILIKNSVFVERNCVKLLIYQFGQSLISQSTSTYIPLMFSIPFNCFWVLKLNCNTPQGCHQ